MATCKGKTLKIIGFYEIVKSPGKPFVAEKADVPFGHAASIGMEAGEEQIKLIDIVIEDMQVNSEEDIEVERSCFMHVR